MASQVLQDFSDNLNAWERERFLKLAKMPKIISSGLTD
jgi:hypothetical protein